MHLYETSLEEYNFGRKISYIEFMKFHNKHDNMHHKCDNYVLKVINDQVIMRANHMLSIVSYHVTL